MSNWARLMCVTYLSLAGCAADAAPKTSAGGQSGRSAKSSSARSGAGATKAGAADRTPPTAASDDAILTGARRPSDPSGQATCRAAPAKASCHCVEPTNLLSDPSFEDQRSELLAQPWRAHGVATVERLSESAYAGTRSVVLRAAPEGSGLTQRVALPLKRVYDLTVQVATNAAESGPVVVGVRSERDRANLAQVSVAAASGYTQASLEFETSAGPVVEVFVDLPHEDGAVWALVDALSLSARETPDERCGG
jgi:hypothetical protein